MRKARSAKGDNEMLSEYDFSGGVRGKYAQRFAQGTNVIVLAPDVMKAFPNSEAVNKALRKIMKASARGPRKAV